MSKRRAVVLSVTIEGRSQADTARLYNVSESFVSTLLARYRAEGDAAFEPRSRRPHTSPMQITDDTVELITNLREQLAAAGTDPNIHHRIRRDRVDKTGAVSLRRAGRMHHISIGRAHAGTSVVLLIADLDIRVINTATGELLRHLTLKPDIGYQPRRE